MGEIKFEMMKTRLAITKLINNSDDYTPEEKKETLIKLIEKLYELEMYIQK